MGRFQKTQKQMKEKLLALADYMAENEIANFVPLIHLERHSEHSEAAKYALDNYDANGEDVPHISDEKYLDKRIQFVKDLATRL